MSPHEFWLHCLSDRVAFRARTGDHRGFDYHFHRVGDASVSFLIMNRYRGDWSHQHRRMTIRWPGTVIRVCFLGCRDTEWPVAPEKLVEMMLRFG